MSAMPSPWPSGRYTRTVSRMAGSEVEPSSGPDSPGRDLVRATGGAVQVRAVRGPEYHHKHRRAHRLLGVDGETAVRRLTESLAVHSLDEQACWMTPGHTTLAVLGPDRTLLAAVTLLGGDWIRWPGWPFDARLTHPDRVAQVLATIGVHFDTGPPE